MCQRDVRRVRSRVCRDSSHISEAQNRIIFIGSLKGPYAACNDLTCREFLVPETEFPESGLRRCRCTGARQIELEIRQSTYVRETRSRTTLYSTVADSRVETAPLAPIMHKVSKSRTLTQITITIANIGIPMPNPSSILKMSNPKSNHHSSNENLHTTQYVYDLSLIAYRRATAGPRPAPAPPGPARLQATLGLAPFCSL
jgi:hypothetical protein